MGKKTVCNLQYGPRTWLASKSYTVYAVQTKLASLSLSISLLQILILKYSVVLIIFKQCLKQVDSIWLSVTVSAL